jgi:hypothetical protein
VTCCQAAAWTAVQLMWPTVPVVCPGGFDFTGVEALRFGEFEALDAGDVEGHPAVAVGRVGHGFFRRWCRADARATKMSRSTEDFPAGAEALESRPRAAKVTPGWLLSAAPSLNSRRRQMSTRHRPSRVVTPRLGMPTSALGGLKRPGSSWNPRTAWNPRLGIRLGWCC